MNKHFVICFRIGLCLALLAGPLLPVTAGHNKSSHNRSRKPAPPLIKKVAGKAPRNQEVAAKHGAPKVGVGQTATLLSDGNWLLLGGEGDSIATAAIVDAQSGETKTLANGLLHPRTGHSATVLPDGKVLIFGGIGATGKYVDCELFDPETQTFRAFAVTGLAPRINHTATLLTDGKLFVAGGLIGKGKFSTAVELWDSQKNKTTLLPARLRAGREKHVAVLQPDGTVLLLDGADENANQRSDGELYDPQTKTLTWIATPMPRVENAAPRLEFSEPGDGQMEVDESTLITLRFSNPLSVKTVNRQSVVLHGPQGEVATRVVPAERGMLLFITPLAPLAGNANHNLTIIGASDEDQRALPFVAIGFKTKCGVNVADESGCGRAPQALDFDTWIPDGNNLNGDWRSGRAEVKPQSAPALQAPAGETALAGRVLTLSGNPLANVMLQVGDKMSSTDHLGRFLLSTLPPGRQVLTIQGHTASRPGKTYGTFDVLVDIAAGKTTVLPYTIWLPVLDEQNVARLPVPTIRETSVTTSRVPGMEVRIPSNSVLRMPSGKHHMHGMMKRELTSVAITPIPVDRPPFPLPAGIDDGLLFTLQLHGAKVEGLNGEKRPGLRIVFPNYQNLPAGTRVDFWNYDAENGAGWYMYGHGTVTADRRQVVPDPGVELQSMHCISLMNKNDTPGDGPAGCNCTEDGDPVDLGTGLFVYEKGDLVLPDVIPISLVRTYRQKDSIGRSFGKGAANPYDIYIAGDTYNYGQIVMPDGSLIRFDRVPNSSPAVYEHTATPTRFYKATMRQISGVGPSGAWEVRLTDGSLYQFGIKVLWGDIFGPHSSITGLSVVQDRHGNRLIITRDDSFRMTRVTSPNGHWIQLSYSDSSKRISQATDSAGRSVVYTYDAGGRLWKVADAKGGITEYLYDSSDRMLTIKDPRGIVFLTNEYDSNGRVSRQTLADGGIYQFAYTLNGSGKVTQTDVTNPRGFVRRATFNANGYTLTDTFALGRPEQQTYTYERQAGTNFILSLIDPLGRKTAWTYNAMGDVTSFTQLADTPNAVTTSMGYETTFNLLASQTDPLGHTISYSYNPRGLLASVTNSLGHKSTFKYNAGAQLTSVTDPLNNTTQFNYVQGALVETIDPLGRSSRRALDAAGRIANMTSALGEVGRYEYDNLNNPTQTRDPLDGVTTFTHDSNGNLLTVTDARNNVTSYVYDNMDRVVTRRDPLLHDDTYEYDLIGNLKKFTDRKGQITNFTYDALDRLTLVTYGDSSTTSYTYDAGDRITQSVDSVSGTITYGYDNLDRLTSESTPQGTISYTYDAAGRRTSMTVSGQSTVNYTYDNADRLMQITQGSATVAIAYDATGRRTSVTLPSGVVTEYSYDAASQLTALTYKHNQTVIGNLVYEYDANGARTRISGSLARSVSPQAITTTSYNASNQQLGFGSQTLAYDLNGNLISDGTNTYTWNARNQLSGIAGPGVNASFAYDAAGRRTSLTANGTSTSYQYDHSDIVAEQSTQFGFSQLLNGGLDEVFTRSGASDTTNFLNDGLGSIVSLHNSAGTTHTEYSYGAFGQPGRSGTATNNSRQYAGREYDEGTGLHYYRARYYSPVLQRFISEDPLGFDGGDSNLYAYVSNDPISYVDPTGQSKLFKIIKHIYRQLPDGRTIDYHRVSRITGSSKQAQNARKRGADVVAYDRRGARENHRGAFKDDPDAGDMIHHDPHPRRGDGSIHGRKPHYQAGNNKKRPGHTFYERGAMFFAPTSMTLAGRKGTTNGQFASAVAWDIADAIDPVGITDLCNWAFGLDE